VNFFCHLEKKFKNNEMTHRIFWKILPKLPDLEAKRVEITIFGHVGLLCEQAT
jgi:hypothetical protein